MIGSSATGDAQLCLPCVIASLQDEGLAQRPHIFDHTGFSKSELYFVTPIASKMKKYKSDGDYLLTAITDAIQMAMEMGTSDEQLWL